MHSHKIISLSSVSIVLTTISTSKSMATPTPSLGMLIPLAELSQPQRIWLGIHMQSSPLIPCNDFWLTCLLELVKGIVSGGCCSSWPHLVEGEGTCDLCLRQRWRPSHLGIWHQTSAEHQDTVKYSTKVDCDLVEDLIYFAHARAASEKM